MYRAWTRILEQTESGEMIVIWSPPEDSATSAERSINPIDGWEKAADMAKIEVEAVKGREEKDPKGRGRQNSTCRPL